jgi:hypothetical protein
MKFYRFPALPEFCPGKKRRAKELIPAGKAGHIAIAVVPIGAFKLLPIFRQETGLLKVHW